jgi:predicted transcriptional regulator
VFAAAIALTILLLLETVPSALAGLFTPAVGVAGAALEAAIFGWVLTRQVRAGDRGRPLGAYTLFTSMALAVLLVDALR